MSIGVLIGIFLSVALVNNLVFSGFLGICPFLGVSRKVDMAFGMGCAVTFVITVSGIVTWLIVHMILEPVGNAIGFEGALFFLKYVAFIMVIASMVQLVEMYLKKFFPPLYTAFGVFLPLITTNCAILGACLYIDMKEETQNLLKRRRVCLRRRAGLHAGDHDYGGDSRAHPLQQCAEVPARRGSHAAGCGHPGPGIHGFHGDRKVAGGRTDNVRSPRDLSVPPVSNAGDKQRLEKSHGRTPGRGCFCSRWCWFSPACWASPRKHCGSRRIRALNW